ncbi:MAG: hypothetical protein FWG89_09100 [Treponema sp.]|nr:hypothetical protein [Treponema sp.]
MKNNILVFGIFIMVILLSGCTRTREPAGNAENNASVSMESVSSLESRKLIVYYSLSGNTKFIAEHIQTLTGADIFALELVEPYSQEYQVTLERARQEREAGIRPQLAGSIDNLADYDVVFVGTPNWFSSLSLPIFSFLETHDLSGKTVVPFVTFGGGGLQNTITDLKDLQPNAVVLEEFGVTGSAAENSRSEISQWLERIGMIE